MGDYRKLDVYKLACQFSDRVARAVEKLPARLADTADQLRRADDSIHEAISEGCGLNSDRQLLKHIRYALGSANECEDELHTLNRRDLLAEGDLDLLDMARRLCAMLARFAMKVESDIARNERAGRNARRSHRPSGPRKADSKKRLADSKKRLADSKKRIADSKKRIADSREQASREPGADAESRGQQPSG
jgi:four helix bundle protein